VIYHAPHPLITLERLREITGETLILASATIPEVPGLKQACVFYPGLPERQRALHVARRSGMLVGLSTPFDPDADYSNWFWGLSGSAVRAMVRAAGLEIVDEHGNPFHITVVARVPRS
jgi:hypothetical protein